MQNIKDTVVASYNKRILKNTADRTGIQLIITDINKLADTPQKRVLISQLQARLTKTEDVSANLQAIVDELNNGI
jgi:hypothetical protein